MMFEKSRCLCKNSRFSLNAKSRTCLTKLYSFLKSEWYFSILRLNTERIIDIRRSFIQIFVTSDGDHSLKKTMYSMPNIFSVAVFPYDIPRRVPVLCVIIK